jgi:hypothetical protein
MRKATLAATLATLSFASSPAAFAAVVWTPVGVPSSIQVVESGGFIVYFSTSVSAICGDKVHIYPDQHFVTESGAKSMLATALAALSAEKTIRVMYDDSTSNCWGRYLTISR